MWGGETPVPILNLVQMFDQQIAPARRITEEGSNFFSRLWIDASSLERGTHAAALAALLGHRRHATISKVP